MFKNMTSSTIQPWKIDMNAYHEVETQLAKSGYSSEQIKRLMECEGFVIPLDAILKRHESLVALGLSVDEIFNIAVSSEGFDKIHVIYKFYQKYLACQREYPDAHLSPDDLLRVLRAEKGLDSLMFITYACRANGSQPVTNAHEKQLQNLLIKHHLLQPQEQESRSENQGQAPSQIAKRY